MPAGARLAALAMTIVSAAVFLIATVPSRLPEHVASAEPVNSGTTGIRTGASGLLATDPGPEELNAAPYKNGGFAIEFAIRPAAFGGNTVGSVLSYSTGDTYNWAIEQHGQALVVLHRNRGTRFANVLDHHSTCHFLVEFAVESVTLYRDGERLGSAVWKGRPVEWEPDARLTIANLDSGDYPWTGTLALLRLHESLDADNYTRPALELSVPSPTAIELQSASGAAIPVNNYAWRYQVKFENLLRADRQIVNTRDVVLNILLTLFLGASLAATATRVSDRRAVALATIAVCGLSLAVESLQFFSPVRVASLVDVGMNTLGALVGASIWVLFRMRYERRIG